MGKKRETIEFDRALVEVEERPGYLLIVESGRLGGVRDVRRYQAAVDKIVRRTGLTKALIDARGEVGEAPGEVRDAMWDWLLDPKRGFEVAAFVLPEGMAVARVNMTALSRGANLRAFESVSAAQRWLARGGRPSSSSVQRQSSYPPGLAPSVSGTSKTMRPGQYSSTAPRVDSFRPKARNSGKYPRKPEKDDSDEPGGTSSVA